MPKYFVLVHIESVVDTDTESTLTTVMEKFGFSNSAESADHVQVPLAPWLYAGSSTDDSVILSRRLRGMVQLALSKELNLFVMQGEEFHMAYTQGSMLGITDLDPDGK